MAKNFSLLFLLDVEVSPLSIAKIGLSLLTTPEVFTSIVHRFECKVQNFKIEK